MARPRINDTGLPECVYLRKGRYYLVKDGEWRFLTRERSQVESVLSMLRPVKREAEADIERFLRQRFSMLKARPHLRTGRLKAVSVDADYIISLARAAGWKCAVTGLPLSLSKTGGRMPYAPSIDRIDCADDYVPGNVRIVALIANLAMNEWGEAPLREMARFMRRASPEFLTPAVSIGQE